MPQQVCVTQGTNLALPIDQLLAQIREKFAVQLERYHIELDDGNSLETSKRADSPKWAMSLNMLQISALFC